MKTFKATIWAQGPGDAWLALDIPFDVEKVFGSRGRVSVKVVLSGETFHTSIFPTGNGGHHMMFNKAMQKASGAKAGDTVTMSLERDEGTEPEIPAALLAALKSDKDAAARFKALTPAGRREYIAWIVSAKREGTRVDRSAKALRMVMAGKKRPSE
ncbi:MAG: DUF1905 domain-containing protein [Alphaproteobacteria bacterium]|nr:DUF1905 domain-containing protein [Alphaproteobacteria bacterium]